jgi:hypothetical protein
MNLDMETRDYFYSLIKEATPASLLYIVQGTFGWLEGYATNGDEEALMALMAKIQTHVYFDKGIDS